MMEQRESGGLRTAPCDKSFGGRRRPEEGFRQIKLRNDTKPGKPLEVGERVNHGAQLGNVRARGGENTKGRPCHLVFHGGRARRLKHRSGDGRSGQPPVVRSHAIARFVHCGNQALTTAETLTSFGELAELQHRKIRTCIGRIILLQRCLGVRYRWTGKPNGEESIRQYLL